MWCSGWRAAAQHAVFIGDVFHHLLQVYYPHWNFPKNSDAEQARASRRMVLEHCASTGALVLPGHVGAPFAGYIEAGGEGLPAAVWLILMNDMLLRIANDPDVKFTMTPRAMEVLRRFHVQDRHDQAAPGQVVRSVLQRNSPVERKLMDLDLKGRSVVISGASKGIGRAVAEEFAREGCSLFLVARTAADLERARDEIRARHNVPVEIHAADLSRPDDRRAVVEKAGRSTF